MISNLYSNYEGNPEHLIMSMKHDAQRLKEKYGRFGIALSHNAFTEDSTREVHKRIMRRFEEKKEEFPKMLLSEIAMYLNCSIETARTICRNNKVRYKKAKRGPKAGI